MRKEELIKQVAESTGIAICEVRTVIEAPAHVEKETPGFRRDNSVFSAGKDCEPVFFFCLPEDLAEIGLGHEEAFRGGGDGTAV